MVEWSDFNISLPAKTVIDKKISKKQFFENSNFNLTKQQKESIKDIKSIFIKHKLSNETFNFSNTKIQNEHIQNEFFIFHVELKQEGYADKALLTLQKAIPYNILFICSYKDFFYYSSIFNSKCFNSKSNDYLTFDFKVDGMEHLYKNILFKIMDVNNYYLNIEEAAEKKLELVRLYKENESLDNKLLKEKQYHKKVEFNRKIKENKKITEKLTLSLQCQI